MEFDEALAVEVAEGLFEGFFAGLEGGADFLGRAGIAVGEAAFVRAQCGEDAVGERGDALVALRVEPEVDLAIGADGAHEAFAALADLERYGEFGSVEEPEAGIVDNGVVTEGRLAGDEERDFVAGFEGRRGMVDVALQPRGGDDAFGLVVDENIHDHGVADLHAALLLGIRQEKILAQTPVQEGTHARVDFPNLQRGEVADSGEWLEGGCDEAVLGIPIDEHLQHIAGGGTFWNGIARQEDFTEFPAIEKKPGAGVFKDSEVVEFSEKRHGKGSFKF